MLLEASTLVGLSINDSSGQKVGKIESCVFDGKTLGLSGFGVNQTGLLKKDAGLDYIDVLLLTKDTVSVDSATVLTIKPKTLQETYRRYGPVVGVTAKTESGKRIGKVIDVFFEAETGQIIRFYLRNILREQIIPRSFVVSLTPQAIIFKDIVDQPIFDQVATAEATL